MANRLSGETSPYLLQHADNPVDWYPWGDEAFARARAEDKPVLLSVGYSSCHWCHVMAHESFEDERTAALMNELFVCIKVDREERPDVDSVYMQAVLAMNGHGGWPMTVFLTPSAEPFFGGTYFPPVDRQGMRGFPFVLSAAAAAYRQRRGEVDRTVTQLHAALLPVTLPSGTLSTAALDAAADGLVAQTDRRHGGFGAAPKFPHPFAVDFLLRRYRARDDRRLLDAALLTLDRMARGGIQDQVGGGFHRYAVDNTWAVPHFEKMLYDNAQLAAVYLHAHLVTGDAAWRSVAEDTLDYAIAELRLPGGGFASSQDADSPGGEGSYFVWNPRQLAEVLGAADAALAARVYGVSENGNFEGGRTVLSLPYPLAQVARALELDEPALRRRLAGIRAQLLEARRRRPAPARDDKVITSWNALMIAALAEAGAALDRSDYLGAALAAADFLLGSMRPGGVLMRTWKDGQAKISGFLEDSAFLADSLLTLYEASGGGAYLAASEELVEDAWRRFHDHGVLYDTAIDTEPLIVRPRTVDDNPIPAGQSMLASALLRLGQLTGDARHRERAQVILEPMARVVSRSPVAVGAAGCAIDRALSRPREIAIVGSPEDQRTRALVEVVHRRWLPDAVLAWGDVEVALLAGRSAVRGAPAAYVCESFACRRPVTEPRQLATALDDPQVPLA